MKPYGGAQLTPGFCFFCRWGCWFPCFPFFRLSGHCLYNPFSLKPIFNVSSMHPSALFKKFIGGFCYLVTRVHIVPPYLKIFFLRSPFTPETETYRLEYIGWNK